MNNLASPSSSRSDILISVSGCTHRKSVNAKYVTLFRIKIHSRGMRILPSAQVWQRTDFFSCISYRKVPRFAVSLICPVSYGTERYGTRFRPRPVISAWRRNHREEKSSETKHRVQTKWRKAADNNNDNDERRERSQFSNGPEKVVAIHLLTYITLVSSLPPTLSPRGPLPTGLTPTRAHRQPTNCPVTHEPVVHVIAVTHKMTSGASPPRSAADPSLSHRTAVF